MFIQRTARFAIPLLAVFLLVGCSREKTYSTADGDVKVKTNARGDKIEITAEDHDGKKITAESGANVQIPSDFPADLPIYKNAKPLAVMKIEKEGHSVTLESVDSLDTVYSFYVDALQANGWTLEAQMDFGTQKMIAAKKGDQTAAVSLGSSDGKTQIVLTNSNEQ